MIDGLEIADLGGQVPVQAEGRIAGRPFYFRARHDEWSFAVADDPEGDALQARFGCESGWFRMANWSCAELTPDPGIVTWLGDDTQPSALPMCDHIYCAGWMGNVTARDIIVACARALLAGEPSVDWTEPTAVTAMRALQAGLDDGSLQITHQDMGWFTLSQFERVEPGESGDASDEHAPRLDRDPK